MTKLQEEMLESIKKVGPNAIPGAYADASAEVALKWIEKAFDAGRTYEYWGQFGNLSTPKPDLKIWLKENGLKD